MSSRVSMLASSGPYGTFMQSLASCCDSQLHDQTLVSDVYKASASSHIFRGGVSPIVASPTMFETSGTGAPLTNRSSSLLFFVTSLKLLRSLASFEVNLTRVLNDSELAPLSLRSCTSFSYSGRDAC